jgi:hypothetical protein
MEVVDRFDVKTFCLADVFENFPICACRSVVTVSTIAVFEGIREYAHEHWNSVTKKQATFNDTV